MVTLLREQLALAGRSELVAMTVIMIWAGVCAVYTGDLKVPDCERSATGIPETLFRGNGKGGGVYLLSICRSDVRSTDWMESVPAVILVIP